MRERLRLAEELIGEAARAGRCAPTVMGLLWQVVDLLLAGDRHAARRLAELRALLAEAPACARRAWRTRRCRWRRHHDASAALCAQRTMGWRRPGVHGAFTARP